MSSWKSGFIAGLVAAVLATAFMLGLRLVADVPSLPELVLEGATRWLPVSLFGAILGSLGGAAKSLGFSLLFLAQLGVGGALGALLGRRWSRGARGRARLRAMLVEALVLCGVLAAAILAMLGPNGSVTGVSAPLTVFGVATAVGYRWLMPLAPEVARSRERSGAGGRALPASRRHQVERLAWGGIAIAGGLALWRFGSTPRALEGMGTTPGSRGTRRGPGGVAAEVTANADFYTVSKNLADPRVRVAAWNLHISGEVRRAVALSYDEVRAMPHREQWQTLLCISNAVGGDFMGNAVWTGVPLADLLARTGGVTPQARRVLFRAADGYADSVPLEAALDPAALLATTMNGEPLPNEHGAPARLLLPGVYGMKNVKWVTALDVVSDNVRGYWQQRGWSDAAVVKTTSRIDFPRRGGVGAAETTRIAGVAFAGNRGISRVEISDDGGQTWRAARLAPPKGPLTWVLWDAPWSPVAGEYRLMVRATDGRGAIQPSETAPALPDGAAGYHQVNVRVA